MFKVFKVKFLVMFIATVIVGGISTKALPMFYNVDTTLKKSQMPKIKEKYVKDEEISSQEKHLSEISTKDVSFSDEENSKDSSQENKYNIAQQESLSSSSEKTNSNSFTIQQSTSSSQLHDTNSDDSPETQTATSDTLEEGIPTIHYDRTTSIYANDNITLLRVEYYVNNKLTYYSVVEQFDAITKSYIEKIYQCNRETNIDPLIRTDVYVNDSLTNSY